jgi:hypothetical protein
MTDEALLKLALQACHDHTAQPVLGDAILERKDTPDEWYDERVMAAVAGEHAWPHAYGTKQHFARLTMARERRRNAFFRRAAKPDRRWCRYVAGFMWLGEWSGAERWPLINHAFPKPKPEDLHRILRNLWPAHGISEMIYGQMPFLGVNREVDPTRLAGLRLERDKNTLLDALTAEMDDISKRIQEAHSRILYAPTGTDDD